MNITLTGKKITQDERILAFKKDNLTAQMTFTVDTDDSWVYKLDVRLPVKCCTGEELFNIIDLPMDTNRTCTIDVTAAMVPFTGKYTMQLRGISGEQVYHSDTFEVWVKYSIDPGMAYDPVPSEFYQIEQNVTEMNNHPPKPGQNGYWLVWDITTSQYKESDIPLPDGMLPEVTADTSGKYLSNDGKKAYWAEVQTGTESKIDKIEVNGVEQPIVDKTVNIAVPTKTSDLSNDSGYITNEALYGYATKAELPTKVSQLENDSKFINESALDGYAKTADIPTKTSQLDNDSGYITANDVPVKSVDGATGDVVTNAVKTTTQTLTDTQKQQARTNIGAGTSSFDGDYNSLTNKPTIPTKTSELTNDSGYITDAALTGYAKTTDIPTKTSQLDNDSNYITAGEAPVQSVNTKTGAVVLTQDDVGDGTTYVRTHNDFTDALKTQINTNEDNIAMAESDINGLQTDVGTLKTNVTSLQTALTSKQDVIVGAASTIAEDNLVADRALVSNSSGKVAVSNVTSTELGYLDGVTGNVQTQLNNKLENIPIATSTTLGGVKPVAKTSDMTQSVGVDANGALYTVPGGGGTGSGDMLKSVYDATSIVEQSGGIADYVTNNSPVTSVNGKTGAVTLGKSDVGLGSVDNVRQYSDTNPPPYPVTSVNGHTGDITVHEVPAVTTSDNGKFLRVDSGAWVAAEGGASFDITGASTGQSPIINAVDAAGKPTAWGTALLAKVDGSNIPQSMKDTFRTNIATLPGVKVYGKADANGKIMAYTDAACTKEVGVSDAMGLVEYGNALLIYDHKTYQCVGFEEAASMQGSGYYTVAVFFRSEIVTDSAGAVLKVETAKLNIMDYISGMISAPITITAGELPLNTTTTT